MAKPPLVFICYSRRDAAILRDLLTQLEPFVKLGKLRVWYDLQTVPGDTPDARIQAIIAEASIALLLVSPDFLASAYVEENELPPIFAAAHAGRLAAVPFFVRPSMVQNQSLTFTTEKGKAPFLLTYWQGLNQPDSSLAETGNERDRQLVEACTKLLELAKTVPARSKARRQARKSVSADGSGRPEVTIRLSVQGSQLRRDFLGPTGPLLPAITTDFRPLAHPLGQTWEPADLFTALFGTETNCTDLLKLLLDRKGKLTPVSTGGARVRVAIEDPRLLCQSWHSVTWKANLLREAWWSFECALPHPTDTSRNYSQLRLDLPCVVAIAAPDPGQQLHANTHAESMRTIGERASGSLAQPSVAHRWHELELAWHHQPSIFYFHGRAHFEAGELLLRFVGKDGSDNRSIKSLAELWRNHSPRIAVFNLADPPPGTTETALATLLESVPLVILQRASLAQIASPDHNPHRAAEALFQSLLHGPESDPVAAVASHCLPATTTWTAFSQFSRTKGSNEPWLSPRTNLDREDQRAQALDQCDQLVRDPELRTTLLIAYGPTGNHLDELGGQVHARIAANLAVKRIQARLPTDASPGSITPESLTNHVHKLLAVTYGRTLSATLEQRHKEWFSSRSIGLILLDFGAHGGSSPQHGRSLSARDVQTIATFCRDNLATGCPASCRIAALLTLEVQPDKLDTVARMAAQLRSTSNQRFRIKALDRVGEVHEHDLFVYLSKPRSGCPEALATRFASAMFRVSQGNFEAAVARIEQAHRVGWSAAFLEDLEQNAPAPSPAQSLQSDAEPL